MQRLLEAVPWDRAQGEAGDDSSSAQPTILTAEAGMGRDTQSWVQYDSSDGAGSRLPRKSGVGCREAHRPGQDGTSSSSGRAEGWRGPSPGLTNH